MRLKSLLATALLLGASGLGVAQADAERTAFKVCSDGHYLPMSNRAGEGFENKIAELLAAEMGLPVEYYHFPQRMGFIRNTLRKKNDKGEPLCEIVMGVPYRYELAITTEPLYSSTYALVFRPEGALADVERIEDVVALPAAARSDLRIGMHERNPGVQWLAENDMLINLEPYIAQLGDPEVGPNELEERDLLSGKIDMVVVWGPIAGRISRNAEAAGTPVRVLLFDSTPTRRMAFSMAMAVHYPNGDLRDQLDELIVAKRDEIEAILTEYRVPMVEAPAPLGGGDDDDDDDDDGPKKKDDDDD